jgi:hypothetical protein
VHYCREHQRAQRQARPELSKSCDAAVAAAPPLSLQRPLANRVAAAARQQMREQCGSGCRLPQTRSRVTSLCRWGIATTVLDLHDSLTHSQTAPGFKYGRQHMARKC